MNAATPEEPIDISFLDALGSREISFLINERLRTLLSVRWGLYEHDALSRQTVRVQKTVAVIPKLHSCIDIHGVDAVNRALKASGRSYFRKRRFPIVPPCIEAAMSADPDDPIDTTFLAGVSDQDVALVVDEGCKSLTQQTLELREQLRVISSEHPYLKLAVRCLIKRHGADALYQVLDSSGRRYFRDRRFAADLGL